MEFVLGELTWRWEGDESKGILNIEYKGNKSWKKMMSLIILIYIDLFWPVGYPRRTHRWDLGINLSRLMEVEAMKHKQPNVFKCVKYALNLISGS